eukprot:TRINITY_DN6432_c0_g1_i1.p1 TRINITY_DN6432_c0_g1~~TRINITY_DN6432_c0_g1_i1.p1  ORF type:complete len:1062 (-),score=298.21 TRINITY_DN6432_c0_g1_i1:53-3238(-)
MTSVSTENLDQWLLSDDLTVIEVLTALFRNISDRSAEQRICHALHRFKDIEIIFYLPQLCHLLVVNELPHLQTFLFDRCRGSIHFALRTFFLLQAAVEDDVPDLVKKALHLSQQCELAANNAQTNIPRIQILRSSGNVLIKSEATQASEPSEIPAGQNRRRSISYLSKSEDPVNFDSTSITPPSSIPFAVSPLSSTPPSFSSLPTTPTPASSSSPMINPAISAVAPSPLSSVIYDATNNKNELSVRLDLSNCPPSAISTNPPPISPSSATLQPLSTIAERPVAEVAAAVDPNMSSSSSSASPSSILPASAPQSELVETAQRQIDQQINKLNLYQKSEDDIIKDRQEEKMLQEGYITPRTAAQLQQQQQQDKLIQEGRSSVKMSESPNLHLSIVDNYDPYPNSPAISTGKGFPRRSGSFFPNNNNRRNSTLATSTSALSSSEKSAAYQRSSSNLSQSMVHPMVTSQSVPHQPDERGRLRRNASLSSLDSVVQAPSSSFDPVLLGSSAGVSRSSSHSSILGSKSHTKTRLYEYFYSELHLVNSLFHISQALLTIHVGNLQTSKAMREKALKLFLEQLNQQLIQCEYKAASQADGDPYHNKRLARRSADSSPSSSTLSSITGATPQQMTFGMEIPTAPGWVIVQIHPEYSACLNSRNRVPYLMLLEILSLSNETHPFSRNSEPTRHQSRSVSPPPPLLVRSHTVDDGIHPHEMTSAGDVTTTVGSVTTVSFAAQHDPSAAAAISSDSKFKKKKHDIEQDWVLMNFNQKSKRLEMKRKVFGEFWHEKEERMRKTSHFGQIQGWRLCGIIVKSGDDLRQEQLASQIIFQMHSWFQAAGLPLFLRPYTVLATNSTQGLIECIPDTTSIDNMKKKIPKMTMLDYFHEAYGRDTPEFRVAQSNFVESVAAYSLVCWLLQIKDRHNGNILIDTEGHLIHIDFGFMLSATPGNIRFEAAPFKLTSEMVAVIGGENSDMFRYFRNLLLAGLLEVRKHAADLLVLIEINVPFSKMACFVKGGPYVINGIRDRLALDKSEDQCEAFVDKLIKDSRSSWTTSQYDSYQYYTNGIL